MSGPDALFPIRNAFYLGAYQAAINESASIDALSEAEMVERDCLVYRSYIALGSYQLVINEINDSAPTSLQAVKLLALYLAEKDKRIRSVKERATLLEKRAEGLKVIGSMGSRKLQGSHKSKTLPQPG